MCVCVCVRVCMCVCRSFEKMRLNGIVFVLFRFLLFCLFVVVRDCVFFSLQISTQ